MKTKHLFLTVLLALGSFSFSQETENVFLPPPPEAPKSEVIDIREIFFQTDVPAEFKGGKPAMMKFIANKLTYPERARKENIQGKCWARFVVSQKGEISDIKIVTSVPNCPECDAEVIRIIQAMPKWTPGTVDKKAVHSYFFLPVNFSLL